MECDSQNFDGPDDPATARRANTLSRAPDLDDLEAPRRRALVVDDCEDIRTLGKLLVAALGFDADLAANGAEALERFAVGDYAFVLMDCNMPVCDGLEAARRIRSLETRRGGEPTPIIAVSSEPDVGASLTLRTSGVTCFLPKPLRLEVLRRELQRRLPGSGPRPH